MSRKLALFCALIGLVAFVAAPAYAEVQNIKVSGDIQAMAVYRNNYDLEGGRVETIRGLNTVATPWNEQLTEDDQDSFLMSIARLRVDADLTDNVAACIRLANIREWDSDENRLQRAARNIQYNTIAAFQQAAWNRLEQDVNVDEASIVLDLAYITLKEMLYSPLTLVIGRQELNYGSGMIVGYGLYQDPNNSIGYRDLSPLQGYDAVRAILDYDPWSLELLYAKMVENDDLRNLRFVNGLHGADRDSDTDLYGVNVGYEFNNPYNGEIEAYVFAKRDENYWLTIYRNNPADTADRIFEENKVYTGGLRGSMEPMENLTLAAEVAGQWGQIVDETQADVQAGGVVDLPGAPDSLGQERDRRAMLGNIRGQYDMPETRFNPSLALEYLYVSGEEIDEDQAMQETTDSGNFNAWDPMYRGNKLGTIRDCLETLYTTMDPADTSGFTNQHTIKASCGLNLGELANGLSLDLAYLHYWFDESPSFTNQENEIGGEVDMALTYDYTEDVQFVLNGAWFLPGSYYDEVHLSRVMEGGGMNTGADAVRSRVSNDPAVSVIGSCKVTF